MSDRPKIETNFLRIPILNLKILDWFPMLFAVGMFQ